MPTVTYPNCPCCGAQSGSSSGGPTPPLYILRCDAGCPGVLLPNRVRITITGSCPDLPPGGAVVYATPSAVPGMLWDFDTDPMYPFGDVNWRVYGSIRCGGAGDCGGAYCQYFAVQGGMYCSSTGAVALACCTFVNQTGTLASCNPFSATTTLYGGVFVLLIEDYGEGPP